MSLVLPPPDKEPRAAVTCEPLLYEGVQRGMLLRNVLSKEECAHFIAQMEEIGLSSVSNDGYATSYRNNDRLICTSFELGNLLFERMRPFLGEEMNINVADKHKHHSKSTGKWKLAGLNEYFRLCRYEPGGHFSPHYDSQFSRTLQEMSLKTVMLYLNDTFEGGSTNLLNDDYARMRRATPNAPGRYITSKIRPETGMAIVFDHMIFHEGDKVSGGRKYIMRSDVMYKQIDPFSDDDNNDVVSLMKQSAAHEKEGDYTKSAAIYRHIIEKYPSMKYQIGM